MDLKLHNNKLTIYKYINTKIKVPDTISLENLVIWLFLLIIMKKSAYWNFTPPLKVGYNSDKK